MSFQSLFEGENDKNDWYALHSKSVRVAEWLIQDQTKQKRSTGSRPGSPDQGKGSDQR